MLILFLVWGCNETKQRKTEDRSDSLVKYAEGFELEKIANGFLLTLESPSPQTKAENWFFAFDQDKSPKEVYDHWIEIPACRLIVLSTPPVGMLAELGKTDCISGVHDLRFIWNPDLWHRADHEILEVGQPGTLNLEVLLAFRPDLILIDAFPGQADPQLASLQEAGIPIMPLGDWMEAHPLGRAEWIKVLGALTGEYEKAAKIFEEVVSRYDSLRQISQKLDDEQATTLVGAPYKDAWFVPGGESYMGHLLQEAGAEYPWASDSGTAGLRLSFEEVYPIGLEAEFWLAPGQARSEADLLVQDERFAAFKPIKDHRVYNYYRRSRPQGGNDYWEAGVVRPDLILADLIKILHPEQSLGDSLYFFSRLPEKRL